MTTFETLTAETLHQIAAYVVAITEDEDGGNWAHVCELNADGLYMSIYRAASLEDAFDVLSIYIS